MGWEPRYGALKVHRPQIKVRHVDHYRYDDQYHDYPRTHQNFAGYKGKALFVSSVDLFSKLLSNEWKLLF